MSALSLSQQQMEKASGRMLLDAIHEAVILLDMQLHVYYLNAYGQELLQLKPERAQGHTLDQIIHLQSHDGQPIKPWPLQSVITAGETKRHITNAQILLGDQTVIPITYSIAPIRQDGGDIVGVMVVLRDIQRERELIRLRSEFVSIVSHQLRTPASAVKWYLEALIDNRRGNPLNDWQQDKLHQAYQSNERMIHLINDLLNVSRLDSGRFELHPKALAVGQLVDEVIAELVHFASAHNVEIVNNLPDTLPNVLADADKLREVLMNFLTNAIKYSRPGHRVVQIGAAAQGHMIEFFVEDQGIGIPKKDLVHIFEKFYRADNAIESQTEGSGLGLYIAREIIQLQGGQIRLTSEEHHGTTIYFSLPLVNH